MNSVSYAIREDPYSIFLLTDGGNCLPNACQIVSLRKKLIYPEFYSEIMYFDPQKSKYSGRTNNVQEIIDSKVSGNNYVAKVSSQIEFRATPSLIEKLQKTFMPAWPSDSYISFLGNEPSGVLVILQVFRVKEFLDPKLLEKGNRGSSAIVHLYDADEEETSVPISIISPVLPDVKFQYLKDEVIHVLDTENAILSQYDNNSKGIQKLKSRIEVERLINKPMHKGEQYYDPDSPVDMAQLDYAGIYSAALEIAPTMETLIEQIRDIIPAQLGESDKLFYEMWNNPACIEENRNRLIDTQLRSAVKAALNYWNTYGVDFEDAFQEATIGIINAVDKYHKNVSNPFGSYAAMWSRQVIERYLPIGEDIFRFPVHYKNTLFPLISVLRKIERENGEMTFEDIVDECSQRLHAEKQEIIAKTARVLPVMSSELLYENIDQTELEEFPLLAFDPIEDYITEEANGKLIEEGMKSLSQSEQAVIRARYGFDGKNPKTLEEIGQSKGVTRERIRQIEATGLTKMKSTLYPLIYGKEQSFLTNSVDVLPLKKSLREGLKSRGYSTIGEFETITEEILKSINGVGKTSIDEAKKVFRTLFNRSMPTNS